MNFTMVLPCGFPLFYYSTSPQSPSFLFRHWFSAGFNLSWRVGIMCRISSILQMGKGPWSIYGNGRLKAPRNRETIFILVLPPAAVAFPSCMPYNNVCALSGCSVVAISHCQMIHGFVLLNGLITWQTACCTGRLRSTTIIKINAQHLRR